MCSGITQFSLENMNGAKGRSREKIDVVLLQRLHLISLANLTLSPCISPKAEKGYNEI
jgi:hypothetical protein